MSIAEDLQALKDQHGTSKVYELVTASDKVVTIRHHEPIPTKLLPEFKNDPFVAVRVADPPQPEPSCPPPEPR